MTIIKDGVILICDEPDSTCAMCGAEAECRPYGVDGASICFDCGLTIPDIVKANFNAALDRAHVTCGLAVNDDGQVALV